MTIWKAAPGAEVVPRDSESVVAIGTFDGVHRGHQQVLASAQALAHGRPVVAVTFDPHPLVVVRPDSAPAMLTSLDRRIELLAANGADEVRVLSFDAQMAQWSPEQFVDDTLVGDLMADEVVVGENFRFGHRNAGDVNLLAQLGTERGFEVESVPLAGDGEPYSSTRIRSLLEAGDVSGAAAILGRPAEVSGVVVEGDKRGRELGFPTANVPVDGTVAIPADGVYACWLVVDGERMPAATSVGTNPTFGENARRVESFVIDHPTNDLDLYGLPVTVEFVEHLRPMVAFDSVDALVAQIHDDVSAVRGALSPS